MSWEFSVLDFIREHFSGGFSDKIMVFITRCGDKGYIWIAAALIMCMTKKYRKCGITLIIGLLAGVLIGNLLLKNIVCRDRPCWVRELDELLIAVPKDYSFPSGHTLSSFLTATVIVFRSKRLGIAAFAAAALIAFSRMYLYVHFPTDIIGGAVIGSAVGIAAVLVMEKYFFCSKIGRKI
ncbi:MAG: phosphatase PAP2 family protein [Alistipes sp.]|nr:phosphatase PAP2 family protein [Alistipes sp.]